MIVAALLLTATPAQAAPVSGDLKMLRGAELTGDITWSGGASIVDLPANEGAPAYSLDFEAAQADVYVRKLSSPGPVYAVLGDSFEQGADQESAFTSASLESMVLHRGAHLTVSAPDATVDAYTTAATLQSAREVAASVDPEDQHRYDSGAHPYSLFANDQIVVTAQGLALNARGAVVLAMWEGELTLRTAEGTQTFAAGEGGTREGAVPLVGDDYERQIVWIVLRGADLWINWSAPATLVGPAPTLSIVGEFSTPDATGNLVLDNVGIRPRGQSLSLAGAFALTPRLTPDATPVRAGFDKAIEPYDRFRGQLDGDADHVFVAGARLTPELSTGLSPVAVGAAGIGLLVVVGVLYRYGPMAFAVLYSRREHGDLLTNPIRSQIYDIVRAKPGITGRQIQKMCAAGWGTIVYHLDRLSRGGILQGVRVGRATHWFTADEAESPTRRSMATQLRGSAGKISRALVSNGPSTAGQLATGTGMARSSAYRALSLLKSRGFVARIVVNGRALYQGTDALRSLLRRLAGQDEGRSAIRASRALPTAPIFLD